MIMSKIQIKMGLIRGRGFTLGNFTNMISITADRLFGWVLRPQATPIFAKMNLKYQNWLISIILSISNSNASLAR